MTRIEMFMHKNGISIYRLSKETGIQYATLHDLVSGKTSLLNTKFEYASRIAKVLGVTLDALQDMSWEPDGHTGVSDSGIAFQWRQKGKDDYLVFTIDNRPVKLKSPLDCVIFHKELPLYDWAAGCLIDHIRESFAFTGNLEDAVSNVCGENYDCSV